MGARSNPNNSPRDTLLDTGFTGVTISRSIRRNQKAVVVVADQMIKHADGGIAHSAHYVGAVTETDIKRPRIDCQEKLNGLLTKAVAVRRHYKALRAEGIYPTTPLRYSDVPANIRKQPVELPKVSIYDILNSYTVTPRPVVQKTTGGDPEALAVDLQTSDLTQPRKPCYLQGRFIRFAKTVVEEHTFYLPRQLYRSHDQWRIKLPHRDGWFCDSIQDDECDGDMFASLQKAWVYLVSLFRAYEPPQGRPKYVAEPLLSSGLSKIFLLPQRRVEKQSGVESWRFTLTLSQDIAPRESRRTTVASWSLNELNDQSITEALCKAEAMDRYRSYRLNQGLSIRDAYVSLDTRIPAEFWPSRPACPILADDVRFYVKRRGERA